MTAPAWDLSVTTRALERGNWPLLTPAALQGLAGPTEDRARLVTLQLAVAESMRCQAEGWATSADERLDMAARALPTAFRRSERGRCFAVLPAPPHDDDVIPMLVWRTARVIYREQRGLDEHRARLRPGRLSPHEILVVAFVEFLRWVECDYFLTTHHVDGRRICFEPRSASIRQRATDLCQLAEPLAGSIPAGVWRGSGTARLRTEALVLLADGDLVPRHGPGALPPAIPVRCGRVEAHRRARQRANDLDHDAPPR